MPQKTAKQIPHAKANRCLFDFFWFGFLLKHSFLVWQSRTNIDKIISGAPFLGYKVSYIYVSPCRRRPILPVSSRFKPSGWQSQSQRSLSCVQLCIWALTRGRATRAMLMGTKWGVSPRWITEGEEKHVFSCIHAETWDPSLSSFLFLFFPKSNKCEQKYLQFARILN